jgi:hypothetical protein
MYKNIVITSVPLSETSAPIMAPAVLKSIAAKAGVSSRAFDLNAVVYKILNTHPQKTDLMNFFYWEQVAPDIQLEVEIQKIFHVMVDEIMKTQPDLICLSLLHYQCQVTAKWLCYHLKKYYPDIKIVIGGTGIKGELVAKESTYAKELVRLGLIDYYIVGDGENAFYELLIDHHEYLGINSNDWIGVDDLNTLPYPNYDDYDFSLYESPFIGILGSRGCVRQCTFCDVHEHWKKFNYRSSQNIFEEMISQNKKYGSRYFKFQDSLVNGNVKEYNQLIELLAEHNRNNPNNALHWSSYFIFRPASQMSETHWKLTAESGAYVLNVGIESLVEKNRYHLKKNFSNQDVEDNLAMAKKYGIKIFFITLIGYVTETEEDHQSSLQWLRDHAHYADDPIYRLSVGGTLAILPNTWLDRNQEQLGITWLEGPTSMHNGSNHLWEVKSTGNNYETRIRRLNEMIQVGEECGFKIHYATIDPQKELENIISKQMKDHAYTHHI